jgi:AcrR family transcriptional regulator
VNKGIDKGISTRQHILAEATRLFTELGYEATSIDAILKACAISRGALYHHFSSKDQIFEAVFEAVEQEIAAATVAASRNAGSPAASLRAGCKVFLQMARIDRVRQIALIDAPSVLGWRKWREIEERHGFGLLKAGLKAAMEVNGREREPIDQLAHMLLAALIEAALLVTRADDAEVASLSSLAAFDRLIDGILE